MAKELRKRNIGVWEDEKQLSPGQDWATAAKTAMESSDAIIAILTKHSYSSSWVRSELEQALFNEKFKGKFLPVLIGKRDELDRLPWVLLKLQHLQLSPQKSTAALGKKIAKSFLDYISKGQD